MDLDTANAFPDLTRAFVEHSPAPVAMFDREMRYLLVSRSWCRDYRVADRDLIGRSHYEIFPEIGEEWRAFHRRGLAGERLGREADPFPREDGTVDYVDWEIHPWHQEDGSVGGIMILTNVVTDRVRVRQDLERERRRLRSLLEIAAKTSVEESLQEAVDLGTREFGMEAGIIGTQSGDTFRIRASSGFDPANRPPETLPLSETYAAITLAQGRPIAVHHMGESAFADYCCYRRLGYEAYMGAPIRSEGRTLGSLCFFHPEPRTRPFSEDDRRFIELMANWLGTLLERDRLQHAHEHVIANQREFLSVLAHDLKNQIGASISMVDLFSETLECAEPEDRAALEAAESQLLGTQKMLEQLLAWGRETMRTDTALREEPICFGDLASEVFAPFRSQAAQEGIGLRVVGSPTRGFRGDRNLIVRLLHNLVRNAIEHLSGGGTIALEIEVQDHSVQLSIEDNGPGLPEALLEKLNRDELVSIPANRPGHGFGLLLCRTFAHRHHGRLHFLPAPGHGLRVEFAFAHSVAE